MKTLEEIFSENLARFRQPKTQEVFSEELGIPLPTYKRYEAGENIPQGKNRQKLIEALHVPESHLFVDWDEFQPKSGITPQQALKVLEDAIAERSKPLHPTKLPHAKLSKLVELLEQYPDLLEQFIDDAKDAVRDARRDHTDDEENEEEQA